MKISWNTVAEVAIAVAIVVALYALFGGWLKAQGEKITKHDAQGNVIK